MARPSRRGPGPDRAPAPARVQRMRITSIVLTGAFIVMFFIAPAILGSPLFIIPSIISVIAAIATVRDSRRSDGPDSQTLEPGALLAATKKQPVEVDGLLFRGGTTRASAIDGRLRMTDRRLAFVGDDGEPRFDVAIDKVTLAGVPGFLRPQLDLEINGVPHTIRFLPLWDLGATFVGPIIAGEWYAQLEELGAR